MPAAGQTNASSQLGVLALITFGRKDQCAQLPPATAEISLAKSESAGRLAHLSKVCHTSADSELRLAAEVVATDAY